MKTKRNTLFTLCIGAIYALTLICFSLSLGMEYYKGPTRSQERWAALTRSISDVARTYESTAPEFTDTLLASIGNTAEIAALQISQDGQALLSYPADTTHNPATRSMLVRSYSTIITTEQNAPLTLTAVLYLLKPASIFYRGRIAFFIILLATIACGVYLVYLHVELQIPLEDFSNEAEIEPSDPEDAQHTAPQEHTPDHADKKNADVLQTEEKAQSEPLPPNGNTAPDVQHKEPAGQKTESGSAQAEGARKQGLSSTETTDSPNSETDAQSTSEQGLFSPVTGFGWSTYMLPRLDSELVRAASREENLALLTMRFIGLEKTCKAARHVYRYISETFGFNDLVFEYNDDGCSVIIQNVDTDEAIKKAQELYAGITGILKANETSATVAMGISNRSLRLISGNRLALESEQALLHALEDEESPIVAFRVNPEKYRTYLSAAENREIAD